MQGSQRMTMYSMHGFDGGGGIGFEKMVKRNSRRGWGKLVWWGGMRYLIQFYVAKNIAEYMGNKK